MARKKLASLLEAPAEPDTTQDATATEATTPAAPAEAPTSEVTEPEEKPAAASPRFEDFLRKEARFTEDQLDALSKHARRLQRMRTAPGERITDNTLIRVAVDLLMTRVDELQGSNENELRASLGITD
ncbi:hypothetical protein EDF24_3775 [Curtobacterium sp. PhB130]|uniref:hypothetical protein n=1 Tax=Curtobacterium sp. PhB130 TaxID=2485178 RepID=UPI000FC03CA9|nr:hypothetical protein [Curtobacterium sp. PhB130]ROS71916.1 hypothetical protein EDF24_3775 [Curtobacterium sp. PhB130]